MMSKERRSTRGRQKRGGRTDRTFRTAQAQPLGVRPRSTRRTKSGPRLAVTRLLVGRLVGLLLIAALVVVLVLFFVDDRFYVSSAEINGLTYSSREEVYRQAAVHDYSVFWVNSQSAAARIEQLPYVRGASVRPLLPDRVRIDVVERIPTAVWKVGGQAFWVDAEGVLMPVARLVEGLPEVTDLDGTSLASGQRVEPALIAAVRQLQRQLDGVESFAYNRQHGLQFRSNSGTQVYLGEPQGLMDRVQQLAVLRSSLASQSQMASEIDFSQESGYYYRLAP